MPQVEELQQWRQAILHNIASEVLLVCKDYLDRRRQQKSVPSAGAFVFSAACECDAVGAALLAEHKPRLNCLVAEDANFVKK